MRRTKIAPSLRAFVADWLPVDGDDLSKPNRYQAVMADLNALLAAARSAECHSHADVEPDPVNEARGCQICRALARLRRASEGGER